MRKVIYFYIGLCLVLSPGCGHDHGRLDADISAEGMMPVRIHRYDLDLFRVNMAHLQQDLESLRPAYRFFLDTDLGDTAKLTAMKDYLENPRNREFQKAVETRYQQLSGVEEELSSAFQHYRHYYPGFKIPRVYAYISGGDYNFPVQFADSVLLIGLDNYLGRDFKPYVADGLPLYRMSLMNSGKIVPDCMRVLCKMAYPEQYPGNTLLEQMIDAGRRLLFVDAMIPGTDDRLKIGFSKEQYDWIVKNEAHVWAAIIENRLLYTTDGKLMRSFMADGPFTPEFSKESPARLGEWFGWQIVKKYFENQPRVTLRELMQEKDYQKILSLSGYKPEK